MWQGEGGGKVFSGRSFWIEFADRAAGCRQLFGLLETKWFCIVLLRSWIRSFTGLAIKLRPTGSLERRRFYHCHCHCPSHVAQFWYFTENRNTKNCQPTCLMRTNCASHYSLNNILHLKTTDKSQRIKLTYQITILYFFSCLPFTSIVYRQLKTNTSKSVSFRVEKSYQ